MFNRKFHCKWPYSIAMLNYQRVYHQKNQSELWIIMNAPTERVNSEPLGAPPCIMPDAQSGFGRTILKRKKLNLTDDDLEDYVRNGEVRCFKSGDVWPFCSCQCASHQWSCQKEC